MLDLKLIKENSQLVKKNIEKKFQNHKLPLVDKVIELHDLLVRLKKEGDDLRAHRNKLSKEINQRKKPSEDIKTFLEQAKDLPNKITQLEEETAKIEKEILLIQRQIPNIIHKSVPIGKDETKNKTTKKFGAPQKFNFKIKNHVELAEQMGIADFESSAKTSGKGFYYINGKLAELNQALLRFGVDFMIRKKYQLVEPPLMIRKRVIEGVLSFEEFENMVYKVEGEDLYLIGTSEHSLIGKFIDQTIPEKQLPIKLVSVTSCFRKEIGSHGINEKGLWRTHQFNKVEQIILCKPKDSEKYYKEILNNSIEIYKKLKIPIRQLEICSGDLGDLKSKQEDIEAYRPTTKNYEEVGSCSNLTDAQARRLNIKSVTEKGDKYHVHTLNNTAIATSRAMVAILENYQQKDGSIKVPAVLQKYTGFKKIGK